MRRQKKCLEKKKNLVHIPCDKGHRTIQINTVYHTICRIAVAIQFIYPAVAGINLVRKSATAEATPIKITPEQFDNRARQRNEWAHAKTNRYAKQTK